MTIADTFERRQARGPVARRLSTLALLVALVACGGGQSVTAARSTPAAAAASPLAGSPGQAVAAAGAAATRPVDACGLVSPAEAAAALGVAVSDGQAIDQDRTTTGQHVDACNRSLAGGGGIFAVQVLAPVTRAMLDAVRTRLSGAARVEDASGLGEAGFSYTSTGGGPPQAGVYFLKGGYQVTLVIDGAPAATAVTSLATLARTASSRLPA